MQEESLPPDTFIVLGGCRGLPTRGLEVARQRPLLDTSARYALSPGSWESTSLSGLWPLGLEGDFLTFIAFTCLRDVFIFKHSEHLGTFHCTLIFCISGLV